MKWFRHDSDANRDPRLEKVLMRYGAEGYALYWMCIELIAAPIDKHNLSFELEHDAEILAHRLKMDSIKVEEIMRYMVNLELFEADPTTQVITCLKLAARIENSIVKNPQLKSIQQKIKDGIGRNRTSLDDSNPGQSGKSSARLDQIRSDNINTLSDKSDDALGLAKEILSFLNEKVGRQYQPVRANLKLIKARLGEYEPDTLKQMVILKSRQWLNDPSMKQYLRPATLFNETKCAQYVGELNA